MNSKANSQSKLYFLYMLGILVLTFLVFLVGFEEVKTIITRLHPISFFYLALLQLATILMTGYIWFFLVKKFKQEISLPSVLEIHLAGIFVESVTPSVKLGGEAAKIYLMRKRTSISYEKLTAATLVSKFFSLIPFVGLSFLVVIYTLFTLNLPIIVYTAFLGLIFIFSLFILVFKLDTISEKFKFNMLLRSINENPGKIKKKLKKAMDFIRQASSSSRELTHLSERWKLIFIAALVWILYPVKVYLVSDALGFEVSFAILVIATFIAYLINMLPLLPGGLGSFEGSMALVFTYVGLTSAQGLSIALVTRLFTFWFPLALSAIAALLLVYNRKNSTTHI